MNKPSKPSNSYGLERNTNLDPEMNNPLQILNGLERSLDSTDTYTEAIREFERYKQEVTGKENNCTVEDDRMCKAIVSALSEEGYDIDPTEAIAVRAYSDTVEEIAEKYESWGEEIAEELYNRMDSQEKDILQTNTNSDGAEIL